MARSRQAQELAILKLYAVLSQAHFVKQQAEEWEGAFLGILALGFPLLLKHTAEVVIHSDKGYSSMVSCCCMHLLGWPPAHQWSCLWHTAGPSSDASFTGSQGPVHDQHIRTPISCS